MKKSKLIVSLVVMLGCLLIYSSVSAFHVSEVKYNLFDKGSTIEYYGVFYDLYQYDYTVINKGIDPIFAFGVTFNPSVALFFGNESDYIDSPSDDWSYFGDPPSLTVTEIFFTLEPDMVTPIAPIASGESLSGFSIRFWTPQIPTDLPGVQPFHTFDTSFLTDPSPDGINSGTTAPIPEPGTMILLGISITSFWAYSKKRMNN